MEKLLNSRQNWDFDFDAVIYNSSFPYLYFDLACKQLCFRPEKV